MNGNGFHSSFLIGFIQGAKKAASSTQLGHQVPVMVSITTLFLYLSSFNDTGLPLIPGKEKSREVYPSFRKVSEYGSAMRLLHPACR
ncbi:MAG: hypothetical protein WDO16_14390 [Bacteroidota bacterium]